MTFALAVALVAGPHVVEVVKPGTGKVVVQVFVKAPEKLSDREQAAWDVLADVLYDGTAEFSRDRLAQYAGQAGEPLLIESMPGHMRLQVVEPKGGLKVAAQMLESLCERATLDADVVKESIQRRKAMRLSAWDEAILDDQLPYEKVTPELVRNLYEVAFRPEQMTVVAGGDFVEGELGKEVTVRFPVLSTPPPRRTRYDFAPRTRTKHSGRVSTFEFRLPVVSFTNGDSAARMLAVFALGVGKQSSLFQVLRETKGWSYRQEAVLWPSPTGWVPRLLFASTKLSVEQGIAAKDLLVADVDAWIDVHLQRAKGMMASTFAGQNPLSPIWIGRQALGQDLEDQCAWRGLNVMMSGVDLDATSLLSTPVTLEDLKAAAKELLDRAGISVIPGQ